MTLLALFKGFQRENLSDDGELSWYTKKTITLQSMNRLMQAFNDLEQAKTEEDAIRIYNEFIG